MHSTDSEVEDRQVWVALDPATREGSTGYLGVPPDARGIAVFAHDSESINHSPRHRYVAQALRRAGFATLMIYLLTPYEQELDMQLGSVRFDTGLLANRLVGVTQWVAQNPETSHLPIGYVGVGTGGGAALMAAAACPQLVGAVISRGGRPDLAGPALRQTTAPTLLIIGEGDTALLEPNQQALAALPGPSRLARIPGAGHLFEEPGALEQVAALAAAWFDQHLAPRLQAQAVG